MQGDLDVERQGLLRFFVSLLPLNLDIPSDGGHIRRATGVPRVRVGIPIRSSCSYSHSYFPPLVKTSMLSGRSTTEKERRASKAQSLYVATSSFNSSTDLVANVATTHSSFLTHSNHSGYSGSQHSSSTFNSISNIPAKSPKKTRPFSTMFLPSQEELTLRQQQYHEDQGEFYQRRAMNESDEDGLADGRSFSSSAMDYGESDLKDTDSDTRSLIAHLTDLDVSDLDEASWRKSAAESGKQRKDTFVYSPFCSLPHTNLIVRSSYFTGAS